MNKSLLTWALAAFALTGAGTQASAQTAPEDVQSVDLGLPSGLKWASCNVGATTPEGYGYYFAWGETDSKKDYSWATYKYANVGEFYHYKFTKYCTDASSGDNGFIDNKTVLEPEDDAATANWGDVWRMPTDAEWTELREQCTWTYTTLNGVYGYQVASKTNGNSIFLPVAGFRNGTSLYLQGTRGYYSSSSLLENYSDNVWIVTFNHEEVYRHSNNRNNGLSVRPVQDKQEEAEPAYQPKPFTVAQGRQVTFSQGNLWHHIRKGVWRFAPHQYDYIGKANMLTYTTEPTLADSIDLFARSSNNPKTAFGVTVGWDYDCEDYYGDFVDWGTNVINGEPAGTWRTLSESEWTYLFFSRTDADKLFGFTTVGDITGLVVLPDGWTTPQGVTFTPSTEHGLEYGRDGYYKADNYDFSTRNIYTPADWLKMEAAGAVFLPAAGYRTNVAVDNSTAYEGYYWSSSIREKHVYLMEFWLTPYREYASLWTIINGSSCSNGYSVRLVKNYSNVSTDISHPSAAETATPARKVLRNGQILILRNGIYYDLHGRILNP